MKDDPLPCAPVTLIIFNRPELTAKVFERIREARPPQLFIVADGPRPGNLIDFEQCAAARKATEQIDWKCAIHRDYSEANLGCGRRIASGLDEVFSRVEEAIILEDDCLPDLTFFRYCTELLEKYRNETRVGLISGSHHQLSSTREGSSYYFCRYGNIWGWATWRRAWQKFDFSMSDWEKWRDAGNLESLFPDASVRNFWLDVWNETAAGKHDTWDYQWTFCYMRHGMLGVLPRSSLIKNIGFGNDATHTAGMTDDFAEAEPMEFPLKHPQGFAPDLAAEAIASRRFFSKKRMLQRIVDRFRRYTKRG